MTFVHECRRKSLHFCGLFVIVFYELLDRSGDHSRLYMIGILSSILFLFLFADFFRIREVFPEEQMKAIRKFHRKYEERSLSATTYFTIAALFCVIVFEKVVVFASILVGILADAAAALVGKGVGKNKIFNKKTLEGTSTFFLVSIACLFVYFQQIEIIAVALILSLVELFAYKLNDNLALPVICAFLLVTFSLGTFYGGKTLKTLVS